MHISNMLQDKVAVVTGGSSGIGKGIAQMFASQGAKVIVTGRKLEPLQETVKDQPNISYVQGDMTDESCIEAIMGTIDKDYNGQLDILVNNAGWCPLKPVWDITMEDYHAAFDVDVEALVNMTIHALPYLLKSKGNIINMSSVGADHPNSNISLYVGAKAAVQNFTKAWAIELADKGVRVNAIAPGAIKTNIWEVPGATKEQDEQNIARVDASIPMKHMGTPSDIAKAALFLASDDLSGYVTGSVYGVDGGMGAL